MSTVRPWAEESLPESIKALPGMLTLEERQYLIWLTRTQMTDAGAIVDLGSWLGCSSASLAEGLVRGARRGTVQSFDLFRWEPDYMEAYCAAGLQANADFRPLMLQKVAAWRDRIEATQADLTQFTWRGGPIELLFVDAAKSWGLTNAILRSFGPALIPGRSRVVLQDFRDAATAFLAPIFASRPDLWLELESVADGTTVTFRVLKAPAGPSGVHTDYQPESFPPEVTELLVRARLPRELDDNRQRMLSILVHYHMAYGKDADHARVRAECARAAGRFGGELLERASQSGLYALINSAWTAVERNDLPGALRVARRGRAMSSTVPMLETLALIAVRAGDAAQATSTLAELDASSRTARSTLIGAEVAALVGDHARAISRGLAAAAGSAGDEDLLVWTMGLLERCHAARPLGFDELTALQEVAASFPQSAALGRATTTLSAVLGQGPGR